jgi:two-component system response regulator protein BraR/BceR
MYRIFVVEDDMIIAGEMKKHLEKWGYEVETATDFGDIMTQFAQFRPHLVLLDIVLPFYNGHYWCSMIRKISQVPIIFVSSAGDNMNIVMAVNMGGDDFLTKPFDLEILAVKVQAMLRRSYSFQGQTAVMEYQGIILDVTQAILMIGEDKIELTKNEFKILQLLYENIGHPVSRESIMKRLWDNECFVDDNTLTVNVARIRRKLEKAGFQNFIQTRKGLGYMIG